MTFEQSIKTCFKKYAVFSGRASRSEYWWWVLFVLGVGATTGIFDIIILGVSLDEWGPVSTLFWLVTLLPDICVTVRRLHDIDQTGWWVLWWPLIIIVLGLPSLLFAPLAAGVGICVIWMIVWLSTRGTQGDNRFGPDPLALEAQEASPRDS